VSCQRAFSWHPEKCGNILDATSHKKRAAGMTPSQLDTESIRNIAEYAA